MSLNTSHAQGGVLIFSSERILIFYDGIEMSFDMDGNLPHFKGKKKGRAYLTTHRVIFNTKDSKDTLQSFSMPFVCMSEVELEQPVFGANYIKGKIKAETDGNWTGNGKWKMWFTNGGAIEFGKAMLQAGSLASRYARSYQKPPAYTPPSASAPYYQAPPPAYSPPQGGVYGFVPYQTFPNGPPDNSVYMTNAPPPYPGIDPSLTAYPPQQQAPYPPQQNGHTNDAAAAKAAEAASSAYYTPSNPHNIYMPPQASAPPMYDGPPPSYDAAHKKQN